MATLLELKTSVLEIFKRDDKETEIVRAINEAYSEMCATTAPRKLQDQIYKTVVIGREEYPVPDTVLRVAHPVRLLDPTAGNNSSSSYALEFLTKDEYDNLEPNPNAVEITTGKPHAYTLWKNSILLTDIPDKEYVLEINIGGIPTLLVAEIDETIFLPTWDETNKAGALTRLFGGIGLIQEADLWQRIYRYGFSGNEGYVTGGLELLRQLNRDIQSAPHIVRFNGGF
jgi:hypothetical protein